MSSRTAESNKAIVEAWNKEQMLIREGRGTRDWTPEQQKDILEKGKAYDENGFAFQGQHMKSVEKYPEYQGDYRNIQFLTKEEHLEAHNGNWRNPTNWYFNPATKEKKDFGQGKFIPCEIIQLKDSIIKIEPIREPLEEEKKKLSDNVLHERTHDDSPNKTVSNNANYKPKLGVRNKLKNTIKASGHKLYDFLTNHPIVTEIVKEVGKVVIEVAVESKTKEYLLRADKSSNEKFDGSIRDSLGKKTQQHVYKNDDIADFTNRSSPEEHIVRPHGQHYHTKDGLIWKEKQSYPRGGIKDE